MRHARFLFSLALAGMSFAACAATDSYHIDPVHSSVVFNVEHNGFSRSFGRLRVSDGTVRFNPDDWSQSSVDATIDLTSIDMGDAEWNKVVAGPNLLDADRARTAHYVSTSVEKRNADDGVIHGTLTLRGVSRPLDVPFRVNRVGTTIYGLHTVAGFSANVLIDRTLFGMTSNKNSIGTGVNVWLEIEAIRGSTADSTPNKETPDAAAK